MFSQENDNIVSATTRKGRYFCTGYIFLNTNINKKNEIMENTNDGTLPQNFNSE
jgi:hypothetical protein